MEVDVQVGDEILTIEAPDDATDEQIIEAVKGHATNNVAQPKPDAQRSDLDRAKNVLQSVRSGQAGEGVGSDALNLMSAPFRGVRGLAVGAGRALAGEPLQPTLQRTAEAMQPEFKPTTPAEKVATASTTALEFLAPFPAAGKVPGIIGKAARVASIPFGTKPGAAQRIIKAVEKAGVDLEKLDTPVRSAKEATQFVNSITNLRKANALKAIGPQELANVENKLQNLLDREKVGFVGKLFGQRGAGKLTDRGIAVASKNVAAVRKAQEALSPGLREARQHFGDIATRNRVRNAIGSALAAEIGRRTIGSPATSVVTEVAR